MVNGGDRTGNRAESLSNTTCFLMTRTSYTSGKKHHIFSVKGHVFIKYCVYFSLRLPWWLSGKESACQCRRHRFDPWVGKIPWRKE